MARFSKQVFHTTKPVLPHQECHYETYFFQKLLVNPEIMKHMLFLQYFELSPALIHVVVLAIYSQHVLLQTACYQQTHDSSMECIKKAS